MLKSKAVGLLRRIAVKYAPPEVTILVKHLQARDNIAFPIKKVHITDSVPDGPVLVLAPHPDDEAIGMGGALSMHLEKQAEITVLYLTNGRGLGDSNGELIEVRRAEAKSLAEEFPIQQQFWEYEDTQLTNETKAVSALLGLLKEQQPASIYLPSFFDHHFDHFASNQILANTLQQYRDEDLTIFGYEVWDNMPFPNCILNISRHFEHKAAMLKHYRTPMQATDFIELCRRRHALHFTLHIDSRILPETGYAEAFYRLDRRSFQAIFADVRDTMKQNGSLLPSHVH